MSRFGSTFGLRQLTISDRIWRSSQSIDNQSFTQCAWIHRGINNSFNQTVLAVNSAASGYYTEINLLALALQFYNDNTGFINTGIDFAPDPDRWVFLAQTSSSTEHKCYIFDNGHFQEFTNSAAPARTMTEYGWMNETDNQWVDGDAACMRFWNRVLTAAELRVEMRSIDAVSRIGLLADQRGANRVSTVGTPLELSGTVAIGSRPLRLGSRPSAVPLLTAAGVLMGQMVY